MSDYAELIKALREHADLIETSIELYGPSATRLLVYDLRNAAAAIEALQKDLATLQKCYEIADTTADEVLKQLPKRGKWTEIEDYDGDFHYQCSVCGEEWYFIDGTPADNNANYCPRCGAKMEVQDGTD